MSESAIHSNHKLSCSGSGAKLHVIFSIVASLAGRATQQGSEWPEVVEDGGGVEINPAMNQSVSGYSSPALFHCFVKSLSAYVFAQYRRHAPPCMHGWHEFTFCFAALPFCHRHNRSTHTTHMQQNTYCSQLPIPFRPPDILVGWLMFYRDFSFFFFLSLFRHVHSELAERNYTKISHMVGSKCNLKTYVQNLGYSLPLQIGRPKTTFLDDFAT